MPPAPDKTAGTPGATGNDPAMNAGAMHMRRWLPLAAIAGLLTLAWSMGWFDYVSLSALIMHRETLAAFVAGHRLSGVLLYMLLYAALVAISFPGASLLTIAAGFLFGGLPGGAATIVAATAGACVIFLIARSSFGDYLQRNAGPFIRRMVDGFREDSFQYLLTLRLTPVFPFWVINIVPAVLGMRLAPYALATFIGIIPGTLAYAYLGAGLDSIIAAQEAADPGCAAAGSCAIDPSALVTREIVLAMAGLALISILPLAVRKWRQHITGRKAGSA